MILYHGTSIENALSILKNGLDINKAGENWGTTYGKGIYFSPNYETAEFYANSDESNPGIVISINVNLYPFILKKDINPYKSKRVKILKLLKDSNYDSIINVNGDEVIIIDQSVLRVN